MIYFNEELMKKAVKLLDTVEDLSDARKDFRELDDIFGLYNKGCTLNYSYLAQLDDKLRKKYAEINLMVSAAEAIKWIAPTNGKGSASSNNDPYISNLRQDAFGILTHALLKSKEIVDIAEFFDRNYIEG